MNYTASQNQTPYNIAQQERGDKDVAPWTCVFSGKKLDKVTQSGEVFTLDDAMPQNEATRSALEQARKDLNQRPLPIATAYVLEAPEPDPTGLDYTTSLDNQFKLG